MFRVKFAVAGVSKIYSLAAKYPHLYGAKFRFRACKIKGYF